MKPGWISLTFDDGLHEHLDNVAPALNRVALPGTFYTHISSSAFVGRQADWRQVAADGHELGNHTIFHPAEARKHWVRPGNAIENYTLDRMRLELEFANALLSALDGRTERTFAYPCSNSFVGRRGWVRRAVEEVGWGRTRVAGWVDDFSLDLGSTRQSYEPIIGELFVAGRGGGLSSGQQVPPTSSWQRSQIPSVAVENWSLLDLQRHVTSAATSNTWAILQFHGVGGGHHMDCPLPVFLEFVSWLKTEYPQSVITVLEGARRLWPAESAASPPAQEFRPLISTAIEEFSSAVRVDR